VGGADVREVRVDELRRAVAVLYQDPYLFPWTIAENIRYGRLDAADSDLREAARTAEAAPFIERLPQQYETRLGAQGATISGGERQRLVIARAIVKQARVLILDEPTSALDAHSESRLIESLEALRQGRTIFVIAHRLSTVRRADRILVIEDGRLVECGSHRELLAAEGVYARLCAAQCGVGVGAA
jgi:ATP-binding cassette subfamily B protein/subfamily B ATP-binding cassette protein MsbA